MNNPRVIARNQGTDSSQLDQLIYVDALDTWTDIAEAGASWKWDLRFANAHAIYATPRYMTGDDTSRISALIIHTRTEAMAVETLREPDMALASQEAFAGIWDNDEDAVYDRWRELYGV